MGRLEKKIFFSSSSFPCLFLLLLLPSSPMVIVHGHAEPNSCKPENCSTSGPVIRFPFRLKDRQRPHCGYPGFDLFCDNEQTMIHIPSFGRDVVVTGIDYEEQTMILADRNKCLCRTLFYSTSAYDVHDYDFHDSNITFLDVLTLLNCSENVDFNSDYPIPCLSDAEHSAFARYDYPYGRDVGSLPISCQPVKTIAVPKLYPLDLKVTPEIKLEIEAVAALLRWSAGFNTYGEPDFLVLVWYVPGCVGCERRWRGNGMCEYKDNNTIHTICSRTPPLPHQGFQRKHAIIVSCFGSFLLLTALVIITKMYCSWKSNRKLDLENQIKVENFLNEYKFLKPTRYSYGDLKQITRQFKEILGHGGFGSVFKGNLSNGTPVAVKVLRSVDGDGEEFINEVATIGKIHHVNVVRLLGFCADRLKRALIYEYMPNESLEKYIFNRNNNDQHFFGWEKLQQIAVGIAKGIEYLHQGCEQRILHFDIKPHNILLDQNFNPKISDFGLAKLCSKGQSAVSMTRTRGTMGYIAPEVFSRNFGNASYKSDVYSYGMLLLEMVGGRKNIDVTVENSSQVYFPEWVYDRLCQDEGMGFKFEADEDPKIAKKLAIVALWCIQWYPVDRPSMKSVVLMLEGSLENLTMPPNPSASSTQTIRDLKSTCHTNLSTIPE